MYKHSDDITTDNQITNSDVMIRKMVRVSATILIFLLINHFNGQSQNIHQERCEVIGRGEVNWKGHSVIIKECFVALKQKNPDKFEMSFQVRGIEDENVQAWSGFGFKDRDNRYALGLRGGNNQDIYLCKYQSNAKSKMLALEPLNFQVISDKWYQVKVVFWEGHIRIYINGESQPRIVAYDEEYLESGSTVLGGGWLKTEYRELSINSLSEKELVRHIQDSIPYKTSKSKEEKEKIRQHQRNAYHSKEIVLLEQPRTEILLNGDWLFLPGYQDNLEDKAYAPGLADNSWHVMKVPSFWNPVRNWLHLQDSHFPQRGSGISDNYREQEEERCESYTFDYIKTRYAWYRHKIHLPNEFKNKRWMLHFDAVSKIAEVYINGKYVGSHTGMFGEFNFDITPNLHKGENVIAIKVTVRNDKKSADADEKVAQAVSVHITNGMLNSIPHGMFRGDEGGIWQDVKLIATQPVYIKDVYANTNMHGAKIEIEVNNGLSSTIPIETKMQIFDSKTNQLFHSLPLVVHDRIKSRETTKIFRDTGPLSPDLWSPETPNMYRLVSSIYYDGELIDQVDTHIGFRTVEKRKNKFYLNGNPYWLRGANHPPCGIAPNNEALANKFFKLMHDGNEMITRSHGCPFTKAWMNAADHQGVGVSYEGSWPWFLIGEIPSDELITIWKEEMISLVKKYRNHPSLLIWTINNEMYFTMFYHNDPPDVRIKKWKIISEVIKEIRKLSPNTLISADSGYGRVKEDYESNLAPHGIDDGDIDDRHVYFNWYNRDFFQVIDGEWAQRIYWSPGANPDRIFFSQEASTGYTNNDNGHYNRKYLFNNYVPQSWVGDWAYEDKNPQYTLDRHAYMTKELYEVIRRTSPETAGVLLFANVCWFKNVFDEKRITPYPVYNEVKKAAEPVLISAELFGRNFYAGTRINPRICIVNNRVDGQELPAGKLMWSIVFQDEVLSSGSQFTPAVAHDQRQWINCPILLPENLPQERLDGKLEITLGADTQIMVKNDYKMKIASKKWVKYDSENSHQLISVFDLTGETCNVLDELNLQYRKMKDLTETRTKTSDLLIIANLDQDEEVPYNWEDVRRVCGNGTNVLLIHPGKHLQWLYYDKIESVYERTGRVVNMHIPEHGAFDDLGPLELAWWQQKENIRPRACRRSFRLKPEADIITLCTYLRPHTGLGANRQEVLHEMNGIPLLEIQEGKGRLIASELETNMGHVDPISARLLKNLIQELLN